jgi:hypothetical protein
MLTILPDEASEDGDSVPSGRPTECAGRATGPN